MQSLREKMCRFITTNLIIILPILPEGHDVNHRPSWTGIRPCGSVAKFLFFVIIRIAGNKALMFRLTYADNVRYIFKLAVILLPLTSSSLIPEVIVFFASLTYQNKAGRK